MAESGQADPGYGSGRVLRSSDKQGSRHQKRARQHRDVPRSKQRTAAADQPTRRGAADKASQIGSQEGNPGEVTDLSETEVANVLEISGQPEKVEVPHGVGKEARQAEPPDRSQRD